MADLLQVVEEDVFEVALRLVSPFDFEHASPSRRGGLHLTLNALPHAGRHIVMRLKLRRAILEPFQRAPDLALELLLVTGLLLHEHFRDEGARRIVDRDHDAHGPVVLRDQYGLATHGIEQFPKVGFA
ncbi:hypothetical protein LLG90_21535 [Aromatoleum toluclasticum]|uniref:hypothetical protein n=1 Tax=Aromatoleum toluclasticum TaxID=92003 RepID=UPI001D189999|nr:hypothetical protein [Aromatoleum toluclasticum]MCC4117941.1 hypothetical protein [Aromatoleum toluclasticum]